MNEQEKQLLLQDLCARLPWGVNILFDNGSCKEIREMGLGSLHDIMFNDATAKPYLRPMSSMTEDEKIEFRGFISWQFDCNYQANTLIEVLNGNDIDIDYMVELFDWINAHHFDYRGLIPMGLALPAKEGMYNN